MIPEQRQIEGFLWRQSARGTLQQPGESISPPWVDEQGNVPDNQLLEDGIDGNAGAGRHAGILTDPDDAARAAVGQLGRVTG